ncbi:MAG: hypothetical protein Q7R49_01175 [Candidatus Daviesbacteria bacterium]|nr:hypothetical protein [Candidatus Daviesbacteria bacterium]
MVSVEEEISKLHPKVSAEALNNSISQSGDRPKTILERTMDFSRSPGPADFSSILPNRLPRR